MEMIPDHQFNNVDITEDLDNINFHGVLDTKAQLESQKNSQKIIMTPLMSELIPWNVIQNRSDVYLASWQLQTGFNS